MTVFDTTGMGAQGGTNVSPTAGVASGGDTTASAISAIANVGLAAYGAYKEKSEDTAEAKLLSDEDIKVDAASAEIRAINDSVAQPNGLDPLIANAKKRQILLRLGEAGVSDKRVKALMSVGLGGEENFVSEQQRAEDAHIKRATEAGYVFPYMNDELKRIAADNYAESRQYKDKLEVLGKEQALAQGATNLEKSQRANESIKAVAGFAKTQAPKIQGSINQILHDYDKGGNTAAGQDAALTLIAAQKSELKLQIQTIGAESGGVATSLSLGLMAQYDLAEKLLNADISKGVHDNRVARAITFQKQVAVKDLGVQQLAAMESLFPSIVSSAYKGSKTLDFLSSQNQGYKARPLDLTVSKEQEDAQPGLKQANKDFMDDVLDMSVEATTAVGKTPDEQQSAKAAMSKQLNGILSSAGKHGAINPQGMVDLATTFADSRFLEVSEGMGHLIEPQLKTAAEEALQGYGNIVMGAVSNTLDSALIDGKGVLEVATPTVRATTKGVTIDLVPKAGANLSHLQKRELQGLQRRMGKAVGNMVAAGAHLEGHQNYEAWFDKRYGMIFGEKQDDKAKQ